MLRFVTFLTLLNIAAVLRAQPLSYAFQRISTEQGLSTGGVTAICQDKYGYIWIGTNNGLNRFDGYSVKVYEHLHGDDASVLASQVRNIFSDSNGRLWISFIHGLMAYDFVTDRFTQYGKSRIDWTGNIFETAPGYLHIASGQGLVKLNKTTGDLQFYRDAPYSDPLLGQRIRDMARWENTLYIVTSDGVTAFDIATEKSRKIALPKDVPANKLTKIAINPANGEVWLATAEINGQIYRTNIYFDKIKVYNDFSYTNSGLPNAVSSLFIDRNQRLWASTTINGIALYDEKTDKFRSATNNPFLPNSIFSNNIYRIYQDQQGYIWLGSSAAGAIFFHPDYNSFQTILPVNKTTGSDELWARAAVETADGALWLATGMGLVKYHKSTAEYQFYQNVQGKKPILYSNSIRSLCEDRKGNLWIGTASGINLKRKGSEKIEFMKELDGFYPGFTLAITEDKNGTIWFGTSGDGHYYLLPGEKKAKSIREHPILKPYAGLFGHVITEDSRGWLWLGLDGNGLICYNPQQQTAQHWKYNPENDTTLAGNYVYSISESPDGKIWVSTSSGLSCIDPLSFHFTNYDRARGLHTNRITTMTADRHNRIWAGTSQGLLLLDSTRTHTRLFDIHDGLPVNEFSDMPPYRMRDGRLLFPSRRGFVLFNPDDYMPVAQDLKVMLSQVKVFNQPFVAGTNYEDLKSFRLPPGQNYFSIEMTALNYRNPRQTWYAYKLEPYDKKWTYTQDRMANYTNMPGGNYTFLFKASSDPNDWNVPEQQVSVRVGVFWYLSAWFWSLITAITIAGTIWEYRRRSQYKKALLTLERKAQLLAKEKALVQYENLTQQLNPHFLFNSMASLGSLIRFDTKKAGEFLESLSKMYRYILKSAERETVTLQEEINFALHFIHLHTTRFENALKVNINIDEHLLTKRVVPVTLQNFLENAIKHNTLDDDAPLCIDIFNEGPYLVVRNNLQRRQVVESSNKQGLEKMRSLYGYLIDLPMEIIETPSHFIIKVPLL